MDHIKYIDRITKNIEIEKVYGNRTLNFLYGPSFFGKKLRHILSKNSLSSFLYGLLMELPLSKRKIKPFIKDFHINISEFEDKVENFKSFNDFFIRHLKKESRPLSTSPAIIPADGRYYFYQNVNEVPGFIVKGKKFCLEKLLQNKTLAAKYADGAMMMARLCPVDYHRYHFPCDCIPSQAKLINGYLYSVNPVAIKQNIHIFSENKRALTTLSSEAFGDVLFIEIGATNVGSIVQTYTPQKEYKKGDEKGYFSFGGSALIVLFQKGKIQFDADLLNKDLEILCLMGQSMGSSTQYIREA